MTSASGTAHTVLYCKHTHTHTNSQSRIQAHTSQPHMYPVTTPESHNNYHQLTKRSKGLWSICFQFLFHTTSSRWLAIMFLLLLYVTVVLFPSSDCTDSMFTFLFISNVLSRWHTALTLICETVYGKCWWAMWPLHSPYSIKDVRCW